MSSNASTFVDVVAQVRKYMKQLENESKIGHALRKLKKIEMTVDILAETLVGKAVKNLHSHSEHGQLAYTIETKWRAVAEKDKETRKRQAEQDSDEVVEVTPDSGMSFADALKATAVPPPPKKHKPNPTLPTVDMPASPATTLSSGYSSISSSSSPSASPTDDTDDLFVIERKHTMSKVYSGRQKATSKESSPLANKPSINSLMQGLKVQFEEVLPVLSWCTAEQLEQIESRNPSWRQRTNALWHKLTLDSFPKAQCTSIDGALWRSCYKRHIQERDDRLAALSARIKKNAAAQPKATVQPLFKAPTKLGTASSSQRTPLAPITNAAPSKKPMASSAKPSAKPTASAKPRQAPLMAKTLKMMRNRHRR